MNHDFLNKILEKTAFSPVAAQSVCQLYDELGCAIDPLLAHFRAGYDHATTAPLVDALADQTGQSPYSIWLLLLLLAAQDVPHLFPNEAIYWETFSDLRCKALECFDVHGIWGTFVAHWYPRFYQGKLMKLGRMEYESRPCPLTEPITVAGITVNPGDPIYSLHIPASGEPFSLADRLESYRIAQTYLGSPLICLCNSWLLYQDYKNVFAPGSNCRDFMDDFYMIRHTCKDEFSNGWRIFGGGWTENYAHLPENTSMQRAFKQYLLNGGTGGAGLGLLLFQDGKLLTRNI